MNRNTLEDHLPQVFKYVRGWLTVKPNLDHNLSQIDGQIKIHVEPYYLFTIFWKFPDEGNIPYVSAQPMIILPNISAISGVLY